MSTRATFFGIEIGKSGLYVSQKGLDVTGHNIANTDTAGYTRQRLNNTALDPYNGLYLLKPTDRALVGGGAKVQVLEQIRSSFLDRQFRTEQTSYSYWATRTQGLSYVEALFESADAEATLNSVLDGLFKAFNTNNAETADKQQRTYLKQQAIKVTEQLNHMYRSLIDQQKDQNLAVETVATQINNIADQIATLNKSIYAFEIDGQPANDLRDKRNLLVDQLSALVDVEYKGDSIGSKFELKIAGEVLVSHIDTNKLAVKKEENVLGSTDDGFEARSVLYWVKGSDATQWEALDLDALTGGELLAHIKLRDGNTQGDAGIPYFLTQLNDLARALVQTVNEQHRQGYYHPAATGAESEKGINFFYQDPILDGTDMIPIWDTSDPDPANHYIVDYYYDTSKITAGNIRLSDEIMESDYYIAMSDVPVVLDGSDPEKMQVGNNLNGLSIYAIALKQDIQLWNEVNPAYDPSDPDSNPYLSTTSTSIGSLNGFVTSMVLDVATTLEHSKNKTDTVNILLLSADTQRTSIAGVSMDEEMTNLIRYNHAYSGASRLITAMDEALDVLINRCGLVGRS